MEKKLTAEDCSALLVKKQEELKSAGEARYPRRADFTGREVMAIKAFFGPWGRALEAAGIKPPRSDDRAAKRAEKRAAQKQKRKEFRNKTEERGKEV